MKLIRKLLNQFKKLKLPLNQYAIYGSGPIAIRGLREARDLDVVVKDELYKKLLRKYKESKPGQIKIGKIEIYAPWATIFNNPKETVKLINRAETIDGFKFVRLEDLLKWKYKMGRPKDFKDIKLIENYLRNKG